MAQAFLSGGSPPTIGVNPRRRAVYTALTDVLNDATRVHDLFSFCEAFCTVEPKFLVNRFLLHAEQRKLIDDRERHRVAKAMYFAMAKPYDALSRYPAHLVGLEEAPEESQPIPAEISAFADFGLHSIPESALVTHRDAAPAAHKVFQTVMAHLATDLFRNFGHRVARITLAIGDARTQVGAGDDVLSMATCTKTRSPIISRSPKCAPRCGCSISPRPISSGAPPPRARSHRPCASPATCASRRCSRRGCWSNRAPAASATR